MGATTGDFDFYNLGLASGAGLVLPVENLCKKVEIVALGAVGFDVGGHGRAARSDGFIHDVAGGVQEIFGFFPGEGAGFTLGVNFGSEKSLVGVDVAEAGDDGLI